MTYLYNGYEHPELPDADEKEYPCAYLADVAGAGYLFFSTVPLKRHVSGSGLMAQTTLRGTETGSVIAYVDTRTEEPFAWERDESYDSTFDADGMAVSSAMGKYIKWTNTDLYNEDGTLYLAASDPSMIFNLSDFGGSVSTLPTKGASISTPFEIGELPLSLTNSFSASDTVTSSSWPSVILEDSLLFGTAKVGDEINIEYLFPKVTSTMGNRSFSFSIYGVNRKRIHITHKPGENSLNVQTERTGSYLPSMDFECVLSELTYTPIIEEGSDTIAGVSLSGKLDDELNYIYIAANGSSSSGVRSYTNTMVHSSYDDLIITLRPVATGDSDDEPVFNLPLDLNPKLVQMGWQLGIRFRSMMLNPSGIDTSET